MSHYLTISRAIHYIREDSHAHLEEVAKYIGLSDAHFQKIFTEWCGVSPKQFARYVSLKYAKELLRESKRSNLETSLTLGLSGTGRLHDLFVDIEAMTPGEYKNHGENLTIYWSTYESQWGLILIASTEKGICNILFGEEKETLVADLLSHWKHAKIIEKIDTLHIPVQDFFSYKNIDHRIKLHLSGTNFQLKVWEALLSIPEGRISSYGAIAKKIGNPDMSRAVGTAIGDNPIGYIIPCHRVLKSDGNISGYRWGIERKYAILGWEGANTHKT